MLRQLWEVWQEGLAMPITLLKKLHPLRMLLVWDNCRTSYSGDVIWLFEHGIMPLYTL
jgi:hypothetical protein